MCQQYQLRSFATFKMPLNNDNKVLKDSILPIIYPAMIVSDFKQARGDSIHKSVLAHHGIHHRSHLAVTDVAGVTIPTPPSHGRSNPISVINCQHRNQKTGKLHRNKPQFDRWSKKIQMQSKIR
jgi:hypothetical protein